MSLFESTLFNFYKPQSKLDFPTLRQGSRERKNAMEQIENKTQAWNSLPSELRCQLAEPEFYFLFAFISSTYSAALFPSSEIMIDMFLLTAFFSTNVHI